MKKIILILTVCILTTNLLFSQDFNLKWSERFEYENSKDGFFSNYINTIAQSVPVTLGSVTQLSNIVVEPNERIYLEANTSNAVDIVAYGVEIT